MRHIAARREINADSRDNKVTERAHKLRPHRNKERQNQKAPRKFNAFKPRIRRHLNPARY